MPEFFELFWLVIRTCFMMQVLLWETYPLHMFLFTVGPVVFILGYVMFYYWLKVRQIKKKLKRDR